MVFKSLTMMIAICIAACTGQPTPVVVNETKLQLTAEEQKYVQNHPVITWAREENRPPFVYVENGVTKGISLKYLDVISKKTGLKFKGLPVESFTAGIAAVKAGQIDLMTSIRPSAERMSYFGFSAPYAYTAGVFVFRLNNQPRSPLRAGILDGDSSYDYLVERFPDMKITKTTDHEEAMSLLEKGLLDVVVMNEASADFLTRESIIKTRKASADFDYPFSFGYKKQNAMLGEIITKAIASISMEEKKTINESWTKE